MTARRPSDRAEGQRAPGGAGTRPRVLALAAVSALLTAAVAMLFGAPPPGAALFIAAGTAALFAPQLIVLEVVAGQLLAASLPSIHTGAGVWIVLPVIVGVIVTGELLGTAARLNSPVERDPGGDLGRAATAAIAGGIIFGIVLGVGRLPGPTGIIAVAIAGAGCVAAAVLLLSLHRGTLVRTEWTKDRP